MGHIARNYLELQKLRRENVRMIGIQSVVEEQDF